MTMLRCVALRCKPNSRTKLRKIMLRKRKLIWGKRDIILTYYVSIMVSQLIQLKSEIFQNSDEKKGFFSWYNGYNGYYFPTFFKAKKKVFFSRITGYKRKAKKTIFRKRIFFVCISGISPSPAQNRRIFFSCIRLYKPRKRIFKTKKS